MSSPFNLGIPEILIVLLFFAGLVGAVVVLVVRLTGSCQPPRAAEEWERDGSGGKPPDLP